MLNAIALTICGVALAILCAYGITGRRLSVFGLMLMVLGFFTLSSFAFVIGLSLLGSGIVLKYSGILQHRSRVAMVLSIASLAFLAIAIPRARSTIERVQARDALPYESVRDRAQPVSSQLFLADLSDIDSSEMREQRYEPTIPWRSRSRAIAWLHRSAVGHFLETPDFGVMRMGYPSLRDLEIGDGQPIELPAIEPKYAPMPSTGDYALSRVRPLEKTGFLSSSHQQYQSWFLDENRLGNIKDIDHVAGFKPHAIVESKTGRSYQNQIERVLTTAAQDSHAPLRLAKLQLVGLLYHSEPVVYELETMPDLLSADTAPTRGLDAFEQRGLKQLLQGDFIHVEDQGGRVRMIGALRSADSCAECHTGPTNQLLGAFSYVLEGPERAPLAVDGEPLTMNFR